jgi:hypothetical protein
MSEAGAPTTVIANQPAVGLSALSEAEPAEP